MIQWGALLLCRGESIAFVAVLSGLGKMQTAWLFQNFVSQISQISIDGHKRNKFFYTIQTKKKKKKCNKLPNDPCFMAHTVEALQADNILF